MYLEVPYPMAVAASLAVSILPRRASHSSERWSAYSFAMSFATTGCIFYCGSHVVHLYYTGGLNLLLGDEEDLLYTIANTIPVVDQKRLTPFVGGVCVVNPRTSEKG